MASAELFRLPDNFKLDDIDIFAHRGVVKSVPGYGDIQIRQLSAWEWFYVYLPAMQMMGRYFAAVFPDASILDTLENAKVDDMRSMFMRAFMLEKMRVSFLRACKKLGVFRGGVGAFLRKASINDIFEMFFLLYAFNTDGLKKKFSSLMSALRTGNSTTSATSSSSVSATAGKMRIVEKIDVEAWRAQSRN
jgi:hypothetical protein